MTEQSAINRLIVEINELRITSPNRQILLDTLKLSLQALKNEQRRKELIEKNGRLRELLVDNLMFSDIDYVLKKMVEALEECEVKE
jgi:hypothetical protein